MDADLLTALREQAGRYVSGEELSRASGVSRAAIWKQIEKLREAGYRITAHPHRGYQWGGPPDRLIPDELAWRLPTKMIGRTIHSYAATDSTMDLAQRLLADGAPAGTAVFAESQRRGRGRLGRAWHSPAGQGICVSVILRPKMPTASAPLLTLMAAVAVVDAIQTATGLSAQIKWPNDVLVRERKVAGILTEVTAELNQVRGAVIGIGLNVNTPRRALPRLATSLALERGEPCDRLAVARALLTALEQWYLVWMRRGRDPLLAAWRAASMTLGRRVRVVGQSHTVDGQAMDVDPDGALLVRSDTGRMECMAAGEVLIVR